MLHWTSYWNWVVTGIFQRFWRKGNVVITCICVLPCHFNVQLVPILKVEIFPSNVLVKNHSESIKYQGLVSSSSSVIVRHGAPQKFPRIAFLYTLPLGTARYLCKLLKTKYHSKKVAELYFTLSMKLVWNEQHFPMYGAITYFGEQHDWIMCWLQNYFFTLKIHLKILKAKL